MCDQVCGILQVMVSEMEAYRDDRSDEWQEGAKGEAFQEGIDVVGEALAIAGGVAL